MTNPESHAQTELPFAIVQGEPLSTPPTDLYIPPDALEVILEAFEGPLDLLLYLIKRQNLDILDIPIAPVTRQYIEYIEMMEEMRLELAAEYLVMAAVLAEIKSRLLLPRSIESDEEDDPRADLIRRLQEYEQFKQAAEDLDQLPRMNRDIWPVEASMPPMERERPEPEIDLRELLLAFKEVIQRSEMYTHHQIEREPLSVRERMSKVLDQLQSAEQGFVEFKSLFSLDEGRLGVVVCFLAILELLKGQMIDFAQAESFAPIYITTVGAQEEGENTHVDSA
ncbi:MAG: segregation/condensation protein A [Thiothrix sp.]|nr:MAG: segregation/condensation protein A [Thiothrix sp.]